ncbi:hypothetical protein HN858_00155 [Candidatus Falkowbacteria bacterium]|jgi:hypothetical protein|nr:hypothetical protein [Candidatus Falkowbacteria bacterium]MBT5502699.1 hypothetical protein [Candidatus Falkowbacteria bacterium]MBT6573517.1 hypothetical protein [Candidatus Falkowbacteria bacterium]MBT7348067.1 hypothetical protein [Candidatus Falkowbacteria bacterium]MBT7501098.1 hypothetical protein [Candidatus Falkowbacteria bacterium]
MKKLKNLIILSLVLSLFIPYSPVLAIEFNNGYIISDSDLTDAYSMSLNDIQEFLDRRNGTLDTYRALDENGVDKSAAELIWQASIEHQINPKFLLVMLQKEQSIVEDDTPTQKQYDWAMGYGVCDACDPDDPGLIIFKGFATQVEMMASRNRWYIESTEGWLRKAGQTYTIDGHQVYMVNQATANLYNYTPHIHGNYVFWKIWNNWFTQKYPDESMLQAEGEAGVWLIDNGVRRPFFSKSALISRYDIANVISVSKAELEKYEIGHPIKFSNYSILETPMGNVFLLVDNELRKFADAEVLRLLGYNPEEFEFLSLSDFAKYDLGEPITMQSAYPTGSLLQNNQTGGVYYVQDGLKHPIITKDILKLNYPQYNLTQVSPEELSKFPNQDPVKLKNGILVKAESGSAVYVISNEQKRPIVSGSVFEKLGYRWENVHIVDEKSLSNLELGAVVDLDFKN